MLVIAAMLALSVVLSILCVLLAICGPAFTELRLRAKLAVQFAWWVATVAAMLGASAWWRQTPESSFRTLLAIVGCVAMPGLGVSMALRTVFPAHEAGATPWYAMPPRRSAAGTGLLRNARLRRD